MLNIQQNLGDHLGRFQYLMRAPVRAMEYASQMKRIKDVAKRGTQAGAGICCLFAGGGALAAGGQLIIPIGVLAAGGMVLYQAFKPKEKTRIQHILNNMIGAVHNVHELQEQQQRAVQNIAAEAERAIHQNQEMHRQLNQTQLILENHEQLRALFLQRFQALQNRIQQIFVNCQNTNREALTKFRNTEAHLNILRTALELIQERVVYARDHAGRFSLTENQSRFIQQINREELNQHWLTMGETIRKMIRFSNQLQIATNELLTLHVEVMHQQAISFERLNQNLVHLRNIREQQEEPLQRIAHQVEQHQIRSKKISLLFQKILKILKTVYSKITNDSCLIFLTSSACCLISLLLKNPIPLIGIPIFIIAHRVSRASYRAFFQRI